MLMCKHYILYHIHIYVLIYRYSTEIYKSLYNLTDSRLLLPKTAAEEYDGLWVVLCACKGKEVFRLALHKQSKEDGGVSMAL